MKFRLLLPILILSNEFSRNDCFLKTKVKELKLKAQQYYQKHFKKDKKWHFLGLDPQLYPGTNEVKRKENVAKWNKYYECLQEQENALGLHGIPIPEAVQGFEGGFVKFYCKFCLSPKEEEKLETIEWYFGEIGKEYLAPIFYGEHIMLSPEDKTLHIYNLQEEHSGQYVCMLGDSVTVPYYLNVIVNGSLSQVHQRDSLQGPYPAKPQIIQEYNLVVDSEWGQWSKCSTCNKVGKRHKFGYCNVMYQEPSNESLEADKLRRSNFLKNFKNALFDENYKLFDQEDSRPKEKDSAVILPHHVKLVEIFQFGIPCRAHILAKSIKNLETVRNRKDEIMVGFCKEQCKQAEIFVVKDKQGKVIERANNSAGIYSTLQGVPPVTPEVERTVQYERRGVNVVIVCPGNLNTDAPIKWLVEGKVLIPEVIFQESKERIYITLTERITIKRVQVTDSNLYTCWQNDELAGTVRLVIEYKLQMNFNHHVMLIAMLSILSVFAYVFLKAFAGRKHAKEANKK